MARAILEVLQPLQGKLSGTSEGGTGRHTVWQPSAERDAKDPELAKLLSQVSWLALFSCSFCLRVAMKKACIDGIFLQSRNVRCSS